MFTHIVVASDGSEQALAGARLAFSLAAASKADVTLANVVDTPAWLAVHPQAMPDLERLQQEAQRQARDDLAQIAARAPEGVSVGCDALRGPPAATLLDLLAKRNADLAVLGTHGVGARRGLVGSVSSQVMDHAPCSVLLFRGDLPAAAGRPTVVAAVDGSEPSLHGLEEAQALAVALNATLRLVHVVDLRVPDTMELPPASLRRLREHGQQVMHDASARVDASVDDVVLDVREGRPIDELVRACEENLPAVAVLGTRGLHGFRGLLVGSTARELVNHAPCPVLVARPDGGQERAGAKHAEATVQP